MAEMLTRGVHARGMPLSSRANTSPNLAGTKPLLLCYHWKIHHAAAQSRSSEELLTQHCVTSRALQLMRHHACWHLLLQARFKCTPVFQSAEGGVRRLPHVQQQRVPSSGRQFSEQAPLLLAAELVAMQICACTMR